MKITLETALELYSEGSYDENYERQSCEIIDETRWTMVHEIVFYDTATGKFWRFSIDNPKSENSSWDDYNDQLIDCNEVVPREKTVIVYDSV